MIDIYLLLVDHVGEGYARHVEWLSFVGWYQVELCVHVTQIKKH
jgi:hypothetical protein